MKEKLQVQLRQIAEVLFLNSTTSGCSENTFKFHPPEHLKRYAFQGVRLNCIPFTVLLKAFLNGTGILCLWDRLVGGPGLCPLHGPHSIGPTLSAGRRGGEGKTVFILL